ncbi:hypothetical protein KIW84_070040 [Lathyrus oleraceus]|uniref:Uncharacterized protein n=1 Tax=Pisum sativum TaxID=3888 RepID=A0A9D4VGW9_PEA|nr:hypothetical protein KIW84_070040 [Pisum sativum]
MKKPRWLDVVQNDDDVSIARAEEAAEAAARKLTEAAFNHGSADNVTCIVVRFNHEKRHPANPAKANPAPNTGEMEAYHNNSAPEALYSKLGRAGFHSTTHASRQRQPTCYSHQHSASPFH